MSDVYVRTERGLQREQEHHSQTHEEALLGADVFEWKRPCQCALTLGQLNLNSELTVSVDSTAEGESTDKPTSSVVGY